MNIHIESEHMLQAHHDKALLDYLNSVPRAYGNFDDIANLFPRVSGRALRSLMLNAPMTTPELATPTFEYIASKYTPMSLHPVYHALLLGEQDSYDEFNKKIQSQFGFFRNRRVGLELLMALLYLLAGIQKAWKLTEDQEKAIAFMLFRTAESIKHSVTALAGLEAHLDPIRVVYIRSYRDGSQPDEMVAIVDAKTLASYVAAGYTMKQLMQQVAKRDPSSMFVCKV